MNKRIVYGAEARNKIVEGAEMLKNIVASTLGPAGHNVIIYEGGNAGPLITKDGATVSSKVDSDDPFVKIGLELIKEIVSKVDAVAGDGTTTTTIYSVGLLKELNNLVNLGVNANDLRKGVNLATKEAVEFLENHAESTTDVESVAYVSTNGDPELTSLVAEAYASIGENGSVVLADSWSRAGKSYVETSKGIKWQGGIPSSLFVTNSVDNTAVVDNPYIMVIASGVTSLEPLMAYIDIVKRLGRTLVVIAPYFEPKIYSAAVKEGVLLVMSPGTSFSHAELHEALMDLAVTVGTKVVPDADSAVAVVPDVEKDLGTAKHIVTSLEETNIVQPDELEESKALEYLNHIENLKKKINEDDDLQTSVMEGLKERLARLTGGIATIYVGALTKTEKEEKVALLIDAQSSVSSALKYGILPGGGTALLKAAQHLSSQDRIFESEAVKKGYDAVLNVMRAPAKQLVASVKPDDYQYIVQQAAHETNFWAGYNVKTQKVEDLKQSKVFDSAAIEIFALKYSASEIGSFILSDGVIVNSNLNIRYDLNDRKAVEAYNVR